VRIKLILRGKRLGLSLSEIRELLDLYEATRGERAQLTKFLQVLAERRAMLNQQKEDIAIVLAEIDTLERQCRKQLRPGANGSE
jgi:DNA-binding transcriptional MerR regulator